MTTRTTVLLATAVAFTALADPVLADEKFTGYLCCNLRTDGSWISDINYAENGKTVIPAGTPVKVVGYGHYRVHIEIGGKKQAIGNDYSRDLAPEVFAKRYVVSESPSDKLAQYPKPIQDAITSMHVTKGMSREQVLMAVGYPVTSENPNLDAKVWRYWLSSFAEFRVKFDDRGLVTDIDADPDTRDRVVMQ
jgi:SmpA/OmlA family protein